MNPKLKKQDLSQTKLFYAHDWAEREDVVKKLILVSMVLLLTLAAYGGRASGSTAEERGISLGIIIDTSPCSQKTWNVFQTAILEMTYQLRRGDKITVYTAHPGKPRLRIIRVIGTEGKHNASDIIRETTSFSREWLSGANLSRAVELVSEDFYRETNEYQHCLVVLSKGHISSKQVAQLKNLVVNFENNCWPVRFICERTQASRSLLVAANNQQLDLRMLDKPELTEWINATRKLRENKVSPATDTPKRTEEVIEDTKPVQDSGDDNVRTTNDGPVRVEITILPKFPIGKPKINDPDGNVGKKSDTDEKTSVKPVQDSNDHKPKEADGKPIKVEVTNFPGLQIGKPKIDDPNDGPVKKAEIDEDIATKSDEESDLPKDKTPPKAGKWWLWLIVLSGMVVIAVSWYCLKKRSTFDEQFGDQIDGQEDLQQRLIWLVGQQRQYLGDIATLGEVVIGRAIGSSIYIDNENVEERHVRIFKSGRKVKVQNLATSAISVDGVQLNRKQKTDLLLPAEIELAGGVIVSLSAEDINSVEDERSDNNEAKSI
ncbi:MAG: hypothetical protein ISS77_06945 [Phycisphaerae bacterium]|nr:hypothetical protein [Phycisphaerae bacterium]